MDAYDIERYQKIHVWVGSNFSRRGVSEIFRAGLYS